MAVLQLVGEKLCLQTCQQEHVLGGDESPKVGGKVGQQHFAKEVDAPLIELAGGVEGDDTGRGGHPEQQGCQEGGE